jgi:hypothetical protein
MAQWALDIVSLPLGDFLAALDRFAAAWRWRTIALLAAAAVLTWWVYVPLHELAHAWGCVLGGGRVSELDIDPLYGAALLQRVFPFIHAGSDYAGQLRGFDTHGSDATYLLTDFLPFVATILLGVPLLRAAARPGHTPTAQALLFGIALPLALAPFISLTGDYYEMGSILVSRAAVLLVPTVDPARWRSDDLFKLAEDLFGSGGNGTPTDGLALALSLTLGSVLAFLTYALGAAWAGAAQSIAAPRRR